MDLRRETQLLEVVAKPRELREEVVCILWPESFAREIERSGCPNQERSEELSPLRSRRAEELLFPVLALSDIDEIRALSHADDASCVGSGSCQPASLLVSQREYHIS